MANHTKISTGWLPGLHVHTVGLEVLSKDHNKLPDQDERQTPSTQLKGPPLDCILQGPTFTIYLLCVIYFFMGCI